MQYQGSKQSPPSAYFMGYTIYQPSFVLPHYKFLGDFWFCLQTCTKHEIFKPVLKPARNFKSIRAEDIVH